MYGKNFIQNEYTVKAIRFKGTMGGYNEIQFFLDAILGYDQTRYVVFVGSSKADQNDCRLYIECNNGLKDLGLLGPVEKGDYVVYDLRTELIEIYDEVDFETKFREL